jgi:flavin-dependent dehydrogenase
VTTTTETLSAAVGQRRWDVTVVGAGPAGAFAAYNLARRGAAVLLVDRAVFPRAKVCGCCLNPAALATLARAGLGDLPAMCGAVPLTAVQLAVQRQRTSLSLSGWVALSRERFDTALVESAGRAGAAFLPETQATLGSLGPETRTCVLRRRDDEFETAAALVLAADGLGGRLFAQAAPGQMRVAPRSRVGAGVIVADAADDYHPATIYMACGTGGYVGLVRLEDGRLNLAAAFDPRFLRSYGRPGAAAARVLAEVGWPAIPDLADLHWRGTPPLTRWAARPAAPRLLALGDAAGYVEPFTGEGMACALAAAEAVAPLAARAWHPTTTDEWAEWHRRNGPRRQRLIRAAASVLRHPWVARAAIGVMRKFPRCTGWAVRRLFTPSPATPPRPPSQDRSRAPHTAVVRPSAPFAPG